MHSITFIGAGNMASSLIGGLIAQGTPAGMIRASEPNAGRRQQIAQQYGIQMFAESPAACQNAEIIVLAVKPQNMREVCHSLADTLSDQQLVLSIAAGINTASLRHWLQHDAIVRCMPNTPALLQHGISGLYAVEGLSDTQKASAKHVLDAVGTSLWLEQEQQLDAVTAVSGSGPAYFFLLIEAMTAAGVKLGLPQTIAEQLAQHTALGAARMACESSLSATQLRQQVTSPQGTTDAAIRSFESDGFHAMVERALQAAADRSAELAQQLSK